NLVIIDCEVGLISLFYFCFFFFFFSSRRRHTRCLSDWSSDVCSSDLRLRVEPVSDEELVRAKESVKGRLVLSSESTAARMTRIRSEERRVGKECRSRWWAYH